MRELLSQKHIMGATNQRRRIVIVGGGFAGVTLAQRLERLTPRETELVLLSSENHFVFTPLLAETVGREISPLHVVVPGRQMVRRTRWLTAEVVEVDRAANVLHYASHGGQRRSLLYDHLALACGSVVDFNSVHGLATHAYPLKALGDAVFLGNDLIGRLEEAAVQSELAERQRLLTVVVIGGGFSGVEVAGAINDLMERTRRYYPQLRELRSRVVLLQRGDRILPELRAASLSEYALRKLCAHGIEVRLNAAAQEVTAREVVLQSGETIQTGTVVCTVGTASSPVLRTLGVPLERGRLKTEPDMRVVSCSNVWALGDSAQVPNAWDGNPSPPTAQFATRQATQLADNLARVLRNQSTRPFSFRPLGIMAAIGRHNAVAEVLGLRLSGFPAWILWRGVYLAKMPTLLRKIEVAIDWAWSILFPPNLVQLQMTRTLKVGRAHFAAGEFVFRKGDLGDHFYLIEQGRAGVYLQENAPPIALLNPGDHFGEVSATQAGGKQQRIASIRAETELELVTLGTDDFRRLTDSFAALKREVQRSLGAQRGYLSFIELVEKEPGLLALRVADCMSAPAETLSPDMTLEQTVNHFHKGRPGYPVTDAQSTLLGYCGRVQLYDALRAALPPNAPLREFLLVDPPAVAESQHLSDVIVQMAREYVEILPVVSSDGSRRVVGVLSPIDIFLQISGARTSAATMQQAVSDAAAVNP
jgi:NADH:ubiquinone reductase (H+-translocating)